ncbi:MAG TPA: PTS system mannose/fructose/sorbose family transporter subunit IID [Ktedonosporobacter sp.]|nr:PTS system mannose/fructose/sorbose family transporter subunit IID [Ktedonosporobacter sp.]
MSENVSVNATNGVTTTEDGVVVLPKSVVNKAMWRHLITLQWSWNYERMQALGYLYSMLPVINAVYTTKDERITAMKRHLSFYNTNPYIGSPAIFGATVALEAQKEAEVVDSLKVGLMGPLAGIGDTIIGTLLKPIVSVLAAGLVLGNTGLEWLAPVLMILASVVAMATMFPQYWTGYRQGINLAREVSAGGNVSQFVELATIVGLVVIGGFIPSILGTTTGLTYTQTVVLNGKAGTQTVPVQATLDGIIPFFIPILLVAFAYWLIRGLKLNTVWALIILVVVGFVGSLPALQIFK